MAAEAQGERQPVLQQDNALAQAGRDGGQEIDQPHQPGQQGKRADIPGGRRRTGFADSAG